MRQPPTEDVDRKPDGVPHVVVGMTALFAVMFAVLVSALFYVGSTTGKVGAIVLLCLAAPILASKLKAKADRDRDHVHPSR
jgi:hypothetical protein